MKRLLLPLTLLLGGCDNEPPTVVPPPSSSHEKVHPDTWNPDDPELLAGQQIYLQECALCHDEGEENAPVITHTKDWSARLEKGEETLVRNAIEGFIGKDGEMPARGGTESLTDDEVRSAVRFIINFPRN